MQGYRPDRVVRVLTMVVSIAYFAVSIGGALALASLLVVKGVTSAVAQHQPAGENDYMFPMIVPTRLSGAGTSVQTAWGPMQLVVEHTQAELRLPIAAMPWGVFATVWVAFAVLLGLAVLTLHHLRRIFQRVRDGAPFDAQNALRMRTVGWLMLAGALYESTVEVVVALAVRGSIDAGQITVSPWTDVDLMGIFMALVVVALAEVFRRGAELEDEQSLVV
jgi:hypothetical protein